MAEVTACKRHTPQSGVPDVARNATRFFDASRMATTMELHFIDVGLGNMTLLRFPNGTTWLYDCNITEDNEDAVFRYVKKAMNGRTRFQAFVCSHRDADHMRGVKKVHNKYPIGGKRSAVCNGSIW